MTKIVKAALPRVIPGDLLMLLTRRTAAGMPFPRAAVGATCVFPRVVSNTTPNLVRLPTGVPALGSSCNP
jgi:hypothetical protein